MIYVAWPSSQSLDVHDGSHFHDDDNNDADSTIQLAAASFVLQRRSWTGGVGSGTSDTGETKPGVSRKPAPHDKGRETVSREPG